MATAGPNLPTAATGNTNTVGGGTVAWSNPTNIEADDATYATCVPGVAITDDLIGTGFGFSIPAGATINGIQLDVNVLTPSTNNVEKFNNVRLLKAGTAAGTDKATATTLTTTPTVFTYGGSADLWGTTWTPSDIGNANFGALVNLVSTGGGPGTLDVDSFKITVTFTPVVTSSSQMFQMF